jgi:hypothetical protein
LSLARSTSFFLWQAPMHHVFQKFVDRLSGSPDFKGMAVAGYLEVLYEALMQLRSLDELKGPVLWAPVVHAAA